MGVGSTSNPIARSFTFGSKGKRDKTASNHISKQNRDAATWTFILTLQQFCGTSSAIERVAFSFNRRTEPCSIHGISRGIVLRTFSKRWAVAKRGRSSMFSGASVKSCCNEAMHGKFWPITGWGTRTQAWEIAMAGNLVEDIEYRQEQVKKAGMGFELPPCLFGLRGLRIVET